MVFALPDRAVRSFGSHAVVVVLGLSVLGMASSLLYGPDGLRRLRQLQDERQRLAEQALSLMAENQRLRDEIWRLQHDDAYLEQVARRHLPLARPNELIFRFPRSRKD